MLEALVGNDEVHIGRAAQLIAASQIFVAKARQHNIANATHVSSALEARLCGLEGNRGRRTRAADGAMLGMPSPLGLGTCRLALRHAGFCGGLLP